MRGPGILWMLQTAAGLSMAGPMFVISVEYLRTGRLVGGVLFLALGAVALYFPTYFINRIGGPRTWLRRRFKSDGDDDSDGTDGGRSNPLDRLRRR
ncbi:hypothetical protein [Halopiger djelfimassiliensis]|uniref:hypothetical protein n=1 Tax=Halopiger djelfimassiliensis TaxID=1293047 RepID=UPI000677E387|nr:hypothetical protein [Halopiger djelfimassiliensis]